MTPQQSAMNQKIEGVIRNIYKKITESQQYSAIISSGILFSDYKRYERLTPSVNLTLSGSYVVQIGANFNPDSESSSWVLSFVEQAIVKWQLAGINLEINDNLLVSCNNAIQKLTEEKWVHRGLLWSHGQACIFFESREVF